jgi:UDP-GlcNAc3NAcA epimerase
VEQVGDVMYDAALVFGGLADRESSVLTRLGLASGEFLLATVHRAENTDDTARLLQIMQALEALARDERVVLPLHPRTRKLLAECGFTPAGSISIVDPVPFADMVQLEKHARVILTDSGGVQKEAYFHGVPCVTLRDETEWVETVHAGWNQLAGADAARIIDAVRTARCGQPIPDYGTGEAGATILQILTAQ